MATRRWTPIIVCIVLFPALAGCGARRDRVAGLLPPTWTMTGSGGHIATLCTGSWEECGTLKRAYATHSSTQQAVAALTRRLRDAGWTVEGVDHGQVAAFNAPTLQSETARLDVDVSDGRASLSYVHE